MSGSGVFVAQAQPNLLYRFDVSQPRYSLTFGNFVQGQVLDETELTNVVQIPVTSQQRNFTVTLNADNTYTVTQT